ncbi:MAG: insulinase family protein [Bacteroidales bacterium]|nr:insulinase family protein [Bacteroidales bacterium]
MALSSCSKYESVKGDPLQARIYTLENGLKVYMSVNRDEPRIQTYVAVRAGGKDDPSDNTGLAHYLEHMMFKGTEILGTQDYEAERPMLAQIDSLFEVYRTLTDPAERNALYARIDSISFEASKIAIPNEYDKLMSVIGSKGSNAFTSDDVTCYVEEIPSNQVDNWARIQADRFMNCVFRGFHTELEAVYEEKNMSMTDDGEKAVDALNAMLFPHHPYGTQTVIGTQDHLKNPSLRAIRKQKDTYYVPNNVAIFLSGDFDPDQMVATIEKYFGAWQPNPDVPRRTVEPEQPAAKPLVKEVFGFENEFVLMGWRTPGNAAEDAEYSTIASSILSNGLAGLIDLDVMQKQLVLGADVYPYDRSDWGLFLADGSPKEGQSLEEVEEIIRTQVYRLASGDFPEELLAAAIANYRLSQCRMLENNRARTDIMMNSFIDGMSWKQRVAKIHKTESLTKEQLVAWARENLKPENYAVVYKRIGPDPSVKRIDAPKITPIVTNRDKQSAFLQEIAAAPVDPIEPRFVDYAQDMVVGNFHGLELLYKQNTKNDLATLTLWFYHGANADPVLPIASDYVRFMHTPGRSAADISFTLYSLASKWELNVDSEMTTATVSGLAENTAGVVALADSLISHAQADAPALEGMKADLIRSRADAKLRQNANISALQRYMMEGPEVVKATTLTNPQLQALSPEQVLASFRDLFKYQHRILYYGPATLDEVKQMLDAYYTGDLKPAERSIHPKVLTKTPKVYVAPYNSRQFNYMQYSNRGESPIVEQTPYIELFNEYYGSGMNSIVFQEMRESRALAYSAGAQLVVPSFVNNDYYFVARIASQNDKLRKAVEGFEEIVETLPEAPENLEIAKSAILNRIRTQRQHGMSVLYSYVRNRDLGFNVPREKLIYDRVGSLSMFDLISTHEDWVRGRTYHYAILGDVKDLDMDFLRTLGPVEVLSQEEIFGY